MRCNGVCVLWCFVSGGWWWKRAPSPLCAERAFDRTVKWHGKEMGGIVRLRVRPCLLSRNSVRDPYAPIFCWSESCYDSRPTTLQLSWRSESLSMETMQHSRALIKFQCVIRAVLRRFPSRSPTAAWLRHPAILRWNSAVGKNGPQFVTYTEVTRTKDNKRPSFNISVRFNVQLPNIYQDWPKRSYDDGAIIRAFPPHRDICEVEIWRRPHETWKQETPTVEGHRRKSMIKEQESDDELTSMMKGKRYIHTYVHTYIKMLPSGDFFNFS